MGGWDTTTFIPNLQSAEQLGMNSQPPTSFYTFKQSGRIWAAHLSFTVATDGSYGTTTTRVYARLLMKSGLVFGGPVELSVGGPSTNANGDADLSIGGILVLPNDQIQLDVNNGNSMTDGVMSASCVVLFSTP